MTCEVSEGIVFQHLRFGEGAMWYPSSFKANREFVAAAINKGGSVKALQNRGCNGLWLFPGINLMAVTYYFRIARSQAQYTSMNVQGSESRFRIQLLRS